ncbi:hypothetical protein RB598_006479 [Gaeumannomyces tritici]
MKLTAAFALVLGAAAAPAAPLVVAPRQTAELVALTDRYSFELTLPAFSARHAARDPPTLDWTTDGCSSSPDNPLGFPFLPGCHRHDFGYRNFKIQTRFTESNRLRLDNKLRVEYVFFFFLLFLLFCRVSKSASQCHENHATNPADHRPKHSLKYQCQSVNDIVRSLCNSLADVYYAAVRAFGGGGTQGILEADPVLVREYEAKLAAHNALMEEARQQGIIPA